MWCVSQRNEYDVCEGTDRAITNVSLMHVVNCCSHLRDPKCSSFAITQTRTERFDNMSIRFHPVSFNQRYGDQVNRWMVFYDDYHCLLNVLALLHDMFVCPCTSLYM